MNQKQNIGSVALNKRSFRVFYQVQVDQVMMKCLDKEVTYRKHLQIFCPSKFNT